MAAIGIFLPGIDTEEDIIAIRNEVIQTLISGGQKVAQWSSEGTSVTKVQTMSARDILEECNYYLMLIGRTPKRISRTVASFY